MNRSIRRQIVISGVGGQGVLFVTRLLAEAAILRGLPVFTSETHGMAQRGGTVVSHLKAGNFSSPLIRPKAADGLLALHPENLDQHGVYVKTDGFFAVNSSMDIAGKAPARIFTCDASQMAQTIGNPKSINLVMLGFAIARAAALTGDVSDLFFAKADILSILRNRLADDPKMLKASILAIETGYGESAKRSLP